MRLTHLLSALGVAALTAGAALADHHEGGLVVGVRGEINATHNFNRPASRTNSYLFNNKEGQLALNLGELRLSRAASEGKPGFVLRLIDGEVRSTLLTAANNVNTTNVLEAYITGNPSESLALQIGQFEAHTGYERIAVGDQAFFSRSANMQYLQPILGAGVRATMKAGEDTNITLALQNRFNGVVDNGNRDLAYGFQVARSLSEDTNLKINGLFTRENMAAGVNRQTNIWNVVYANNLSEDTTIALDASLRNGKDLTGRNYDATGFSAYLVKKMGNGSSLGIRGEYLSQSNATSGILPSAGGATKPNLSTITLSYQLAGGLIPGGRTIVEYRLNTANTAVFAGRTGAKKSEGTLTIGQTFAL